MLKREFLEAMAKQGDPESIHELANQPTLPKLGVHLWTYWCDLHATRQSNGMAPCRLTRREIHEWQDDEGVSLAPWERRAILALDGAWIASINANAD